MANTHKQYRYAKIQENDIVNGEGVCVSLWTQGCPHHCPQCFNPETWDYNGGNQAYDYEIAEKIISAISANNIQRNFSILGGEPLCDQNLPLLNYIIPAVKNHYPNIKIFIWTGYTIEELRERETAYEIMKLADVVIDGRFDYTQRDITLKWRGSRNQRILYKNIDF